MSAKRTSLGMIVVIFFLMLGGFTVSRLMIYSDENEMVINQDHKPDFKSTHSTTDPSGIWVIVNKQNPLPRNYTPELVNPDVPLRLAPSLEQMLIRPDIADSVKALFEAAEKDNIEIVFGSGYRSYDKQKELYESYVAQLGQKQADKTSARPGYSEHQTGLAVDLISADQTCYLEQCWEDTIEGKWAADNAHRFGFVLHYLKGKKPITGYSYEPWHFRFVGKKLASILHENEQTLEEYFGYPPAPDYKD